ncbi:MAG: hypothetical protein JWM11_55 [Planctomycetaceae bacterium]|nr:hypothetical protein [Planctomycetaceae bacterium]
MPFWLLKTKNAIRNCQSIWRAVGVNPLVLRSQSANQYLWGDGRYIRRVSGGKSSNVSFGVWENVPGGLA